MQNPDKNTNDDKKRCSWAFTDEYYSTPFYQYRGKSIGASVNQDTQVTNDEFSSFAVQETSTDDLITNLRLHMYSKLEIMSEYSLSGKNNEQSANKLSAQLLIDKRCRRQPVKETNATDLCMKLSNNNIKRYENVCSLTGTRRLTLIMPPTSSSIEFDNNIIREIDSLQPRPKYEEYNVMDCAVDTNDLSQHISFENYTYVQLLSENAQIGKGIQKMVYTEKKPSSLINNANSSSSSPPLTGNHKTKPSSNPNHNSNPNGNLIDKSSKTNPTKQQQPQNHHYHHHHSKTSHATQTDLSLKIKEDIKSTNQVTTMPPTISTSDYNYDISDILERYNLKKLAIDSVLSAEANLNTPRSRTVRKSAELPKSTPTTPTHSIRIASANIEPNDKHLDSARGKIKNEDLSHDLSSNILSARENQNQITENTHHRSNRSSSSHNQYYRDMAEQPSSNDYYYYYYNSNNSRYPLISRAVGTNRNNNESISNYIIGNNISNNIETHGPRSKSSKPVLMRGKSLRVDPTYQQQQQQQSKQVSPENNRPLSSNRPNSKISEPAQLKENKKQPANEIYAKPVASNQEVEDQTSFCSNCQRKKKSSKYERPKENEILLKIDHTKVHATGLDLIENNPNIIFIPAVLTTKQNKPTLNSHHYHHNQHFNNKKNLNSEEMNNFMLPETNIRMANSNRYRRSKPFLIENNNNRDENLSSSKILKTGKYDRSLYMYTDQPNKSYFSSSSNESDDTTIYSYKICPENENNNFNHNQINADEPSMLKKKNKNQQIDQLII